MIDPSIPLLNFAFTGEMAPPQKPRFILQGEQTAAIEIDAAVGEMCSNVGLFSAGVALDDLAEGQIRLAHKADQYEVAALWRYWGRCGRRSAAMAVHDWDRAFTELRTRLKRNPLWWSQSSADEYKAIGKRFRETFPDTVRIRDSVAHPETYIGSKNIVAHESLDSAAPYVRVIGGPADIKISDSVFNGMFTTTFDGAVYQCPLTAQAATLLVDLTNRVFSQYSLLRNVA